jgi:heavy metal translocating P-type ATPase
MFLTSALIAGGAAYAGKKVYETIKKPRRNLGALYAGNPQNRRRGKIKAPRIQPQARLKQIRDDFLENRRNPQVKAFLRPNTTPSGLGLSRQRRNERAVAIDTSGINSMVNAEERRINHNLAASVTAMGLATGGALLYPPLSLISVPVTLYTCVDIFQDAYKALFKERRIRVAFLDSIAVVGGLAVRAFFASALASSLYFLGRKLLLKTKANTHKRLIEIFGERPQFVWRLVDGVEVETPFEELRVGDIVVVNAGETVPVDGRITEGIASIDQRVLTGEAQPAEKGVGDGVFASTVVLSGRICIEVEKAGDETVAAQICEILNRTADYQSSIETKGQEIADRSVLPTLGISAIALPTLGPLGAITVLYSNYTDTLRIAAPLGMLNFLSIGSRSGLLVKDGRALELLNRIDTVVFDKTGTLTLEQPYVAAIYPLMGLSEDELLTFAAAAEYRQTHPIARAIQKAAAERGLALPKIDAAEYEVGYGIKVNIDEKLIRVGSHRFMEMESIAVPDEVCAQQEAAHEQGYSFVYVAISDSLAGAIELHPTIRPEAATVIKQLKKRGLSMTIISGDHEQPTRKLADELGIETYFAEVLPEDKANLVEKLQQKGKVVCFVGDGINDSIALKKANVSISLNGASTIATDTSQIILMDGTLNHLDQAFELASKFEGNLKTSMLTTFGPGIICVGGVFFFHFRILAAIMLYNASLVAGVTNAMVPWIRGQLNRGEQTPQSITHEVEPKEEVER